MTDRFRVYTHNISAPGLKGEVKPYWIWVVVHDTNKEMQRAMAKHARESITAFDDVGGGFTHAPTPGRNGYLGLLRFSREYLSVETIVHECVHVAVCLAQTFFACNPLRLPVDGHGMREEIVAYTAGPLAAGLIAELKPAE